MVDPPRALPSIPAVTDTQDVSLETKDVLEHDAESGTYRASFDSSSESVCWAVVSMVATISETRPTALPSLATVIDPDALDAALYPKPSDQSRGDVHVTFRYDGHEVTVHSYGIITVQPEEDGTTAG